MRALGISRTDAAVFFQKLRVVVFPDPTPPLQDLLIRRAPASGLSPNATYVNSAALDTMGGEQPFAAIANLMCAYTESGPPTGGYNAFPFCAAAARLETPTDIS
jgi:hypothetical protein